MNKKLLFVLLAITFFSSTTKVNFDETLESELETQLKTERFEHIKTLVIVQNDEIVYEYYREDITQDTKNDMASAVKTVTSLLIGMAIEQGYINSVDDQYFTYFPEYKDEIVDERYKNITIRNIMSMTDGLDWNPMMDWKNITIVEVKNNPVLYSMKLKLKDEYISTYRYSSLNSQLLSALFNKTTGNSMEEFAKNNLFNQLGIENYTWSKDNQGNTHGGFGLHITSKELSSIALLLVNRGKINGKQIINESWIDEITAVNNDGGDSHPGKYGLHTWIEDEGEYFSYFAMGYGGQFISITPELDLGWIIASDFDGHRNHHRLVVDEVVLPRLSN